MKYRNIRIPSQCQILFGGIFSQVVVAPLLVAPLERVKVLLQVNTKHSVKSLLKTQNCRYILASFRGRLTASNTSFRRRVLKEFSGILCHIAADSFSD